MSLIGSGVPALPGALAVSRRLGARARARGGGPEVVDRKRSSRPAQVFDDLGVDRGQATIYRELLHEGVGKELPKLVLISLRELSEDEPEPELTKGDTRKAEPFGTVDQLDNRGMSALELAIGGGVEAVAAQRQRSSSTCSVTAIAASKRACSSAVHVPASLARPFRFC